MRNKGYKLWITALGAFIGFGTSGFAKVTGSENFFFQNSPQQEQPKKSNMLISGKVKDANSGEPLPNVTLHIQGSTGSTSTNVDGYFTLHNIPSDTSVIVFTIIGYQPLHYRLSSGQSYKNIIINLTIASKTLEEIIFVTEQKQQGFKLNQKVGLIKLTPTSIATLPNMGQKDIFRSFQLMPGVSAGNEQTAGLYVRGGTPDQNLVLFDGFTVYNVDHLFGFFSAFNANAVKDVQLYKGAFEAKYGGRLSSVVDITGKEGNKKQFNGGIDLGFLGINGFIESPIGKKLSGLITYRRSFKTGLYDKIADKLKGEDTNEPNRPGDGPSGPGGRAPGTSQIKSFFDDLNIKFTYNPTQKDVIAWSFYTGKDFLDNNMSSQGGPRGGPGGGFNANSKDETQWGNTGTSLKWSRKWNPKLFSNTLISSSRYFSNRTNTRVVIRDSATTTTAGIIEDNDLKDLSLKSDIEWNPNKIHSLGMGYQLTNNDIKYVYARSDTARIIDRHTSGNTYSFYLQDRLNLFHDKLTLLPGIRTSYFEPTGKLYYEPRFNISYAITENIKVKGSAGQYYQFAKRVVREDILQGSRDFWVLSDDNKLPVSSSTQYIAGISWENNDYLIDAEVYYKGLKGLSEYTLRFEPRPGQNNTKYEEHFYQGTGFARGIDFLLQKKFGSYNGWVGYTLGEVISNFPVYGEADFHAGNDVRHEFKMVHMYKWKNIDFSLTWMYLTGKPYTAPSGGYYVTLLDGTTQEYLVVTDKNVLRLPSYHRLDAAVTINYGKPGKANGTIGLSLFNCYNRKNVWYKNFDIEEGEIIETDVNYLGFTPNLSFTIKLK